MISLTTACKALRDTTEAGQATNQTTHIAPPEQRSFSVSRRLSSGYLNNIHHWIVVISTEKYSNCSVAYAENMTKLKWLVLDQICPGNCICIFPFYETRLRKMHLLCSCPWLCWGEPWANLTARMKIKFTGSEAETPVAELLPSVSAHWLTPHLQLDYYSADTPLLTLLKSDSGYRNLCANLANCFC